MPRYVVQHSFSEGAHMLIIDKTATKLPRTAVTWVDPSVSQPKRTSFRVAELPNPESARTAAERIARTRQEDIRR